jgi:hypothetical protein
VEARVTQRDLWIKIVGEASRICWDGFVKHQVGLDRAIRHRHQLGPVLTAAQVTTFEAEHSVTLPTAYRSFLLDVANGGAGPHYGLFPSTAPA